MKTPEQHPADTHLECSWCGEDMVVETETGMCSSECVKEDKANAEYVAMMEEDLSASRERSLGACPECGDAEEVSP